MNHSGPKRALMSIPLRILPFPGTSSREEIALLRLLQIPSVPQPGRRFWVEAPGNCYARTLYRSSAITLSCSHLLVVLEEAEP